MLLSFRYAEALTKFFGLRLERTFEWKQSIKAACVDDYRWWKSFSLPLLFEVAMSSSPRFKEHVLTFGEALPKTLPTNDNPLDSQKVPA